MYGVHGGIDPEQVRRTGTVDSKSNLTVLSLKYLKDVQKLNQSNIEALITNRGINNVKT
jgi:hypothetical protein